MKPETMLPEDALLTPVDDLSTIPALAALPPYRSGKTLGAYDCGYGMWQLLLECASQPDAQAYAAQLQEAGYELLCHTAKADNLFYQFKQADTVLYVSYVPSLSTLRVIPVPAAQAVLPGPQDRDFETGVDPQVTQIGLGLPYRPTEEVPDPPVGVSMSYVIRLCDGSFIVYDGGMPWEEYAHRLYTVLRAQTPAGRPIVIAAWVLTHAHIDHTGVFDLFAQEYTDRVRVENIVLNFGFPILEETVEYQQHILNQTERFPGARVLRVVTGMDLSFRNAKLEVLFDQTLRAPLATPNINAETLVTRLELDGVTFLFLGDHADFPGSAKYPSYTFNNGAIRRMYGSYLKSDAVQVAHHGLGGGGTLELYELVCAKYTLWPVGEEKFQRHDLGNSWANSYFLRRGVKTFHAFDRVHIFYPNKGSLRWKQYNSFADYEAQCSAAER